MRATPFWLAEVVLCAAAAVASGLLYGHFFAGTGYLPYVCAAAVVGASAAAVAGTRTWGAHRTLLTAVGGFAIFAVYGVFRDTTRHFLPTGRSAAALVAGVVDGWARMLTVAPPVDPRPDLLCTAALVTWAAAFTATTLVLRTRSVFVPVVPTMAAFVVALLFGGRQPEIHVLATAVFLVATVSLVLLRTNRIAGGARRVTTGRLVFGGPAVVVIALTGLLGGMVLPLASGEQRFDPRTLFTPPVRVTDTLTPLADLKHQLREEPPRRLFTVEIAGGARVDRIRVAALDEYDGVSWTSADRFLIAGRELAGDRTETRSRPVTARISVEDLEGPFLPELGRPTRIEVGHPVGFSTTSGVLVSTRSTLRGLTYELSGAVTDRDDGLVRAAPSTSPAYRRYTALPDDLPPRLGALARQLTASGTSPYGRLVAIEDHLRALPYRLDAPPGHTYAALLRVLAPGGGYAEQHAAAFAVLARAAGFPARVAVGYRLRGGPAGTEEVTTRDAHAWAEVHFDGYGWVAFDPTGTSAGPGTERAGPSAASAPPAGPSSPVPRRPAASAGPGADRAGTSTGTALVVVVLVSAVLLVAAAIPAVKAHRRRRRRRAPGNAARVLGAWREATDRLIECGIPVPASLTAHETAGRATSVLGAAAEPVVRLAPLATSAVYAPDEPDDRIVDEAWSLAAELRHRLYPRRLSVRRLRAGLDVRPLVTGLRERAARSGEVR